MVNVADVEPSAGSRSLHFRVTLQAEIHVPLHEHFGVDGAVGVMTSRATLPQRRVLENDGPGFLTMTLGTSLVEPGHGQSTRRFHDVPAVRIVALDTIHPAFKYRVMLWKVEFRANFLMALETGFGVFARVNDEFFEAATSGHGNMFAPRAVAGFAAVLSGHPGVFQTQPRVRTGRKHPGDVRMTVGASVITHVGRAFDLERHGDGSIRGARI